MRLRSSNKVPQAGTRNGESRPELASSGSPTNSGEGTESLQLAQSSTAASRVNTTSSSPSSFISSTHSLFQSPSSSPHSFENPSTSRSSTATPMSVDVEQEAEAIRLAPTTGTTKRARITWTNDMNKFIWRTYLEITQLETHTKKYLEPLFVRFTQSFPDIQTHKQRLGDQRRAIIRNRLLAPEILEEIKQEVIQNMQNKALNTSKQNTQTLISDLTDALSNSASGSHSIATSYYHGRHNRINSQQNNILVNMKSTLTKTGKPRQRMQWTEDINRQLLQCYYSVTNNETNLTTYRPLLHRKFTELFPELNFVSQQRLSDQIRVIHRNNLIPAKEREIIKKQTSKQNNDQNRTSNINSSIVTHNISDTLSSIGQDSTPHDDCHNGLTRSGPRVTLQNVSPEEMLSSPALSNNVTHTVTVPCESQQNMPNTQGSK